MRLLISGFLALYLCLGASMALAQGDPGDQQSGLDFFNMGMSPADAKKMGAKPAGKNEMFAQFKWEDARWNTLLTFKNNEVVTVAMTTKDLTNPLVAAFLRDMGERLYAPFVIVRNDGSKSFEMFLAKDAAEGKDKTALEEVTTEELNTYAGQDAGSILIMFCGQDNFETMTVEYKKTKDANTAMATASDEIIYTMQINKKDDMLVIVYATLKTLGDL